MMQGAGGRGPGMWQPQGPATTATGAAMRSMVPPPGALPPAPGSGGGPPVLPAGPPSFVPGQGQVVQQSSGGPPQFVPGQGFRPSGPGPMGSPQMGYSLPPGPPPPQQMGMGRGYGGPPPQGYMQPGRGYGMPPPGAGRGGFLPPGAGQPYNPSMGMHMSAPPGAPGSMMRPSSLQAAVPAPRKKAALTITDKDGNVIQIGGGKADEKPAEGDEGKERSESVGGVEELTKGVSSLQVAAKKDNSLLEAAKAAIGELQ